MAELFRNEYRVPTNRVGWHDYNAGIYFVTFCTQDKQPLLGHILPNEKQEAVVHLSPSGSIAKHHLDCISQYYSFAEIPLYVIMPNHIHAFVVIHQTPAMENPKMQQSRLGTVVRGLKARITHDVHQKGIAFTWQSRYYDRIVRSQAEMNEIAKYIEQNPARWLWGEK